MVSRFIRLGHTTRRVSFQSTSQPLQGLFFGSFGLAGVAELGFAGNAESLATSATGNVLRHEHVPHDHIPDPG